MSAINSKFNFKSDPIVLNYSATKYLSINVESVIPDIKIFFNIIKHSNVKKKVKKRLIPKNNANKKVKKCQIGFSKEIWKKILETEDKTIKILEAKKEKKIFEDNEIIVFTEKRHNEMCVCFKDTSKKLRVNIQKKTYEHLIYKSDKISLEYTKICDKIIYKANEMLRMLIVDATAKNFEADFLKDLELKLREISNLHRFL